MKPILYFLIIIFYIWCTVLVPQYLKTAQAVLVDVGEGLRRLVEKAIIG
jgi:hypothetical protein